MITPQTIKKYEKHDCCGLVWAKQCGCSCHITQADKGNLYCNTIQLHLIAIPVYTNYDAVAATNEEPLRRKP